MKRFALAAAMIAALAGQALADGYYHGKTLTYIIATSPGGGYDTYGRLIGSYLGKKLGAAKVIFRNIPGAGHIIGANTIYASPPDGLTIGTFNTGLIYAQIMHQQGIQFDLNKFSWIGKASSDARAIVLASNSGLKSFDDLEASKTPVLFAVSGVGSANYTETKMLADGFDLNIKIVPGFNGNEGEMSMMRGEVVGQVASYELLANFVANGNGFYALLIGGSGKPQAADYATTDKARSIVSLIDATSNLGRLTAAPPGVDPAVLEELRNAYMAVTQDPTFLADAKKLKLQIDPERGDKVAQQVAAALQQSPDTVKIISAALSVKAPTMKTTTQILALDDGNKAVIFMAGGDKVTGSVSGSRTDLTIDGAKAKRKALKVGMTCQMEYAPGSGNEFKVLACKN